MAYAFEHELLIAMLNAYSEIISWKRHIDKTKPISKKHYNVTTQIVLKSTIRDILYVDNTGLLIFQTTLITLDDLQACKVNPH